MNFMSINSAFVKKNQALCLILYTLQYVPYTYSMYIIPYLTVCTLYLQYVQYTIPYSMYIIFQ